MTTLVIDGDNLLCRSFYALPPLTHGGERVEGVAGVLKEAKRLRREFNTSRFVWCFDQGPSKRKAVFCGYKMSRPNPFAPGSAKDKKHLRSQMALLRGALASIGFANLWSAEGYEADDLIAVACIIPGEKVIVSSDHDLHQLVKAGEVSCYDPIRKSTMDEARFMEKWGIRPAQFAMVKAIAGCKSDNVPGVFGVGPVNAAKFLAGTLKVGGLPWAKITREAEAIAARLRLTLLPYEGTPAMELKKDRITRDGWRNVMESIGVKARA